MKKTMNAKARTDALAGHLFLLPNYILIIVFIIIPLIYAIYLGFCKYNGFSEMEWIGLKNYIDLFKDQKFFTAMKNSLVYAALTVPTLVISALIISAVLAEKFRNGFGQTTRIVLYLPTMVSMVLVGSIFFFIFASNEDGLVNTVLGWFGVPRQNWLGQRSTAMPVVAFVFLWKSLGYQIVYFYAGIMDIPRDYYEAARIDGATPVQQFIHITVPILKPILYMVLVSLILGAFQAFDIPYAMTAGGPGNSTLLPGYHIYLYAFQSRRMGYASAYALVLGIATFAVNMIMRVIMKEKVGENDG